MLAETDDSADENNLEIQAFNEPNLQFCESNLFKNANKILI